MAAHDEFRPALVAGDFRKLRRISEIAEPHLPRLTDEQAEETMHRARTAADSVPFRTRAYSHHWLAERGIESDLPDHLRPKAEHIFPTIQLGVGIAVKFGNPLLAPAAVEVRKAMEAVVLEADADGRLGDSGFVKARMLGARERAVKQLFGTIGKGE